MLYVFNASDLFTDGGEPIPSRKRRLAELRAAGNHIALVGDNIGPRQRQALDLDEDEVFHGIGAAVQRTVEPAILVEDVGRFFSRHAA